MYTNLCMKRMNKKFIDRFSKGLFAYSQEDEKDMNLLDAKEGEEYIVKDIMSDDEELKSFFFFWAVTAVNPLR